MNNTYRFKIWYQLLNTIIALMVLSSLAALTAVIIFLLYLMSGLLREGQIQAVLALGIFAGIIVLLGCLMALVGIVLPLGNAFFSYLRLEPTGLELRIWPFYRLCCAWQQVTGVEHTRLFGLSLPMLHFEDGHVQTWGYSGPPKPDTSHFHGSHHINFKQNPSGLTLDLIRLLLWSVSHKNLIPVYIFKGWPDGQLKRDLESRLGTIASG